MGLEVLLGFGVLEFDARRWEAVSAAAQAEGVGCGPNTRSIRSSQTKIKKQSSQTADPEQKFLVALHRKHRLLSLTP